MPVRWIKTNQHVYGTIYREHHKEFSVLGSCTAPDGNPQLGLSDPYILTEWGFKGADEPIIKSILTKESRAQKEYDCEYFIAQIYNEDD